MTRINSHSIPSFYSISKIHQNLPMLIKNKTPALTEVKSEKDKIYSQNFIFLKATSDIFNLISNNEWII